MDRGRSGQGTLAVQEKQADPASNVAVAARRASEVLLEFERLAELEKLSDVDRTHSVGGQTQTLPGGRNLDPLSAACISSRLRLTQQTASKAAGLQTVGSLTATSLGSPQTDTRKAGRGITLAVGQVGVSPSGSTKLRVGGAGKGPKIAGSSLVAPRLFAELKQQPTNAAAAAALHTTTATNPSGRQSPRAARAATWASEIRAASLRFDERLSLAPPGVSICAFIPAKHLQKYKS